MPHRGWQVRAKDRVARGIKGERRRCAYVCLIAIEYSVWRTHARANVVDRGRVAKGWERQVEGGNEARVFSICNFPSCALISLCVKRGGRTTIKRCPHPPWNRYVRVYEAVWDAETTTLQSCVSWFEIHIWTSIGLAEKFWGGMSW